MGAGRVCGRPPEVGPCRKTALFVIIRMLPGGGGHRNGYLGESGGRPAEFSEEFEVAHGTFELAIEAGFVARGEGEGVALLIHGEFRGRGAEHVGELFILTGNFAVEVGLERRPAADLAPVGDDHFLNDVVLRLAQGFEGFDVIFEELNEALTGFSDEEDASGEQVVLELAFSGVRALEAAFCGFWAFGFSAIGSGGGYALRGGLFLDW